MPAITAIGRLLLDAVAPLRCAACDAVASTPICGECVAALGQLPPPRPAHIERVTAHAAFTFEGAVREVLHRGKFQGNRAALRDLARLAAPRLDLAARPPPDAVVAVPLSRRRRGQRGYNQAEVVAAEFARAAAAPLVEGLLRLQDTPAQASLGETARRSNVAGAFAWRGVDVAGASLWLVDDVLTTGATAAAAAGPLLRAGARLDAMVIARVL